MRCVPLDQVDLLRRWGHTAVATSSSRVLVFGGFGGHRRLDDLLVLDVDDHLALAIFVVAKTTPWPRARERHAAAAAVTEGMLVCFGRASPNEPLSDIWRWTDGWTRVETTGEPPRPRWGHTLTPANGSFVLAGGRDRDGVMCDLFVLGPRNDWARLVGGLSPGFAHAAAPLDGGVLFFGGTRRSALFWDGHQCHDCGDEAARFAHALVPWGGDEVLVVGGIPMRIEEDDDHTHLLAVLRLRLDGSHRLVIRRHDILAARGGGPFPVHAAAVSLRPDLVLVIGGGVPTVPFDRHFGDSFFVIE
ncbi:hypothetical protein CTAYLR_001463 [Chrysophaeum taylorii]|uniref:Uncharacterized protein n=1 Tax=Chrysophaeum taylorii TaxID=2483200 RepID=A0AAD7XJH4_9STRA|nr:hypothetical protein CTAYLR_001463 [Chrysophaeum taylorii]